MKQCSKCKETKPFSEFRKNRRTCHSCEKDYNKEWNNKNPDYKKNWRKNNPEYDRNLKLISRYGIGIDTYNQLLVEQNYRCAICETDIPGGQGEWKLDHCHETGMIRGLLCFKCNVGLGHFNDDIELCKKAIEYLRKKEKMKLNAFVHYYGGKSAAAKHYPIPEFDTIIEPFCGFAGYSTLHFKKNVILVDKYPVICGIWDFLIKATPQDILKIPANKKPFEHVDELGNVPEPVKWLVGFYMNKATVTPGLSLTAGQKRQRDGVDKEGNKVSSEKNVGWNIYAREKIARQVPFIKHWKIIEGDYWDAPDIEATWYIDPPYQGAGIHYKHNCKSIDFTKLGEWCKTRKGQVIVCENEGADWLDFKPFRPIRASNMTSGYDKQNDGLSIEVIWTNRGEYQYDMSQRGTLPFYRPKKA